MSPASERMKGGGEGERGRERGNGEDNANGLEVFLVLVAATRARC